MALIAFRRKSVFVPFLCDLPSIGNLWHERVFQTGWESSTSSATKTGLLDFVNDPVWAHREDVLGSMPITSLKRTIDEGVSIIVHISENTILILEVTIASIPAGDHLREHHGVCSRNTIKYK